MPFTGHSDDAAAHSRPERLSRIDANDIRIAVYEMTATPPLPLEIAINEAIEIVKRYGTAQSSAFVNGVLDKVATHLGVKSGAKRAARNGF